MESNRFDESIKEKLESRSLQPSNEAWNKLSERLEHEDKKQNNKTFWWMGIAASIIGIAFIGFQFLDREEIKPVIVDSPTRMEYNTTPTIPVEPVEKQHTVIEQTQLKETFTTKNRNRVIVIAENKIVRKEKIQDQKPIAVAPESLTFEAQKIQEVVAEVQKLRDKNQEVSDDAIDALLLQAQRELSSKRLFNKTTGAVDANMLLADVENDLDQSFRSKVFEAIKASYGTVKTAVAQRNN